MSHILDRNAVIILFVLQVAVQVVQPLSKDFVVGKTGPHKFFIETEKKYNWFRAVGECTRRNMSLIAVDSSRKSDALDEILRREFIGYVPYLWIGGQDLGKEGEFVWMSTGKKFNFTNWKLGMPDNYLNDEHCVHITEDRYWNDISCDFEFGFICEGLNKPK